ncbi:hypothetical protein NET02_15110 [Thermomicrobiaceae bacterium CFH 74404]|uniref:Uncharacterized protein n=1 Tax=Thermalbibacter longus TaxID=2951981 RepID=A0AA41WCD6_9BACT|nr:hypothetical protein [Thermalbibacter longus]MCM8750476.1 hypothetical protein [Thermalbibacter longus]
MRSLDWGDVLFIGGFLVMPILVILTSLAALRRQRRAASSHPNETLPPPAAPRADPSSGAEAGIAETAELPPTES